MKHFHVWSTAHSWRSLALGAVAATMFFAGCADHSRSLLGPDSQDETPLSGLVVSEPQTLVTGVGAAPAVVGVANVGEATAFVSMAPGSLPNATSVRIRNVTTGGPTTDPIVVFDEGFDPVAVAASAGDQLEFAVRRAGGDISYVKSIVPARRSPRIVRTNPPGGRTDVALSRTIEVVFSEPIDAGTLKDGVQLLRDGNAVSAVVRLLPGSSFVVELDPSNALEPVTAYQLVITTAVRDLDGDALEEELRVGFSTAASDATFSLVQVSARGFHTCGVTADGMAYCWGSNGAGELGTGSLDSYGSSTGTPKAVAGGLRFAEVSAGGGRTCGVTADRIAYCWGDAEITNGISPHQRERVTPTPVAGGLRFTQVSVGLVHHSGFTSALSSDGAAYCWPTHCWLGGEDTDRPVPLPGELRFTQVSTGGFHACGITTDGAAYCWGSIPHGQLGGPTRVAGDLRFVEVSAGQHHTCGITTDNVAYCWGDNRLWGMLGDGTTNGRLTPAPVSGSLKFAQVSAGRFHTCGVTTGNVAYCWGWNELGSLGDGTTDTRLTPVPVSGSLRFAQVSAGAGHTCGLTTDDVAYCWGGNFAGQLGYGTPVGPPSEWHRLSPTQVVSP